jgi:NAD(P)-dependent dehydrogenase (short-subunit alcohol dehydrogenase family)
MNAVVVTSVSTGIGRGALKVLAGKGLHVFGSVGKAADAECLSREFGAAFAAPRRLLFGEAWGLRGSRKVCAASS